MTDCESTKRRITIRAAEKSPFLCEKWFLRVMLKSAENHILEWIEKTAFLFDTVISIEG